MYRGKLGSQNGVESKCNASVINKLCLSGLYKSTASIQYTSKDDLLAWRKQHNLGSPIVTFHIEEINKHYSREAACCFLAAQP